MQIQALQGYFDNGVFYQHGRRAEIPNRKMVIINVLDIPVDNDAEKKEDLARRAAQLKEVKALIDLSMDEELPLLHRLTDMREPVSFTD